MIFMPLALKSRDLIKSTALAMPMLLIGACAFVANDLDDIEADCTNHPERPLPSRNVSPLFAAVLYFVCLAAALLTTKYFVPLREASLYYLTMVLTISYRYIVAFIPSIKAPYTAATIAVPAIIVANYNRGNGRLYIVALAIFLFALGRELCMDVEDRAGDAKSFMHRLDAKFVAHCAFVLQALALLLISMSLADNNLCAWTDFGGIVALFLLAAICWFRLDRQNTATGLMKLQLLLGLYFLI